MGVPITKSESKSDLETKNSSLLKLTVNTASISDRSFQYHNHTIKKWNSTDTKIIWEVNFIRKGVINVSIGLSNNLLNAGAVIKVSVGEYKTRAKTKFSGGWNRVENMMIGKLYIEDPGDNALTVEAVSLSGLYAGDLWYVLLSGEAAEGATEVFISPRANHVGLIWDKTENTAWFYNQIKINKTFAGTQFTICGVDHVDLMLLHNDYQQSKHVMFSCLGDYRHRNPRSANRDDDDYPVYSRPRLISKGDGVQRRKFQGDENGIHCSLTYPWKLDEVYHGLLRIECEFENVVSFTAYFYDNEEESWKRIASVQLKCDRPYLISGFHSSIRDFYRRHGRFEREAEFGGAWKRSFSGAWHAVKSAVFFQDGDEENVNAVLTPDEKSFSLATGGFVKHEENYLMNFTSLHSDEKLPDVVKLLPD